MSRPTQRQKQIKQAKELLENETLRHIFDEREREIYDRWKGSSDPVDRDECYYEIIALEGLRDAIYATATDDA